MSSPPWRKITSNRAGTSSSYSAQDFNSVMDLFNGVNTTKPVAINNAWNFVQQPTGITFPSPLVTYSPPDFYVYIDTTDGNKIKAKNLATGAVNPGGMHATNADIPLQYAIDQLSAGSTLGTTGDFIRLWNGGKYGTILVGPGTYYLYTSVILKSHIEIIGSGPMATTFTIPDNSYPARNDNTLTLFKSSMWDRQSIGLDGVTTAQLQKGDYAITLRDFQIYGNWRNNVIPRANTRTTTITGAYPNAKQTAGTDSWGHGIAFYGGKLICDGLLIHGCPGAGIIFQSGSTNGIDVGGGYVYPLVVGGVQQTGNGMFDVTCFVRNCRIWGNGDCGILVRNRCFIDNCWIYFNGGPGIDCQSSSANYFKGFGWISGVAMWSDSAAGGNGSYNASPGNGNDTYDQFGFEARMAGWVSNNWIESPWGPGDNLTLGYSTTLTTSGWDILPTSVGGLFSNCTFDTLHFAAILIPHGCVRATMRGMYVAADSQPAYINACPLLVTGSYNDIDLWWGTGRDTTVNGVVMGQSSPSWVAWGNRVRIFSDANTYNIDNQNASNFGNQYTLFLQNQTGPSTKYIIKPGGQAIDYGSNTFDITVGGGTLTGLLGRNGGTATVTGATGVTAYTIPHSLFSAPSVLNVMPANTAAMNAGGFYISKDASNITINFAAAPANGSSNQFQWDARVSH